MQLFTFKFAMLFPRLFFLLPHACLGHGSTADVGEAVSAETAATAATGPADDHSTKPPPQSDSAKVKYNCKAKPEFQATGLQNLIFCTKV